MNMMEVRERRCLVLKVQRTRQVAGSRARQKVIDRGSKRATVCNEECGRCLFHLHIRQELWSQAGNGHTQVGKQAGESKLGQRHKQNELN